MGRPPEAVKDNGPALDRPVVRSYGEGGGGIDGGVAPFGTQTQ